MFPWFNAAQGQILKVETLQHYDEGQNQSFQAFLSGEKDKARSLLWAAKSEDRALYSDISSRCVEFLRCRPVVFPMSDYMRWEIENYKVVEELGERVYLCNHISVSELMNSIIQNDFMAFDLRAAFIHDYDKAGRLVGGWEVSVSEDILNLHALFFSLKTMSKPLRCFIDVLSS